MSELTRHTLYLLVEGLPESQKPIIAPGEDVETFTLTEANAAEALRKIFAADAISVWGEIS
jgi:tRNA pseudouridine-54 N-methylase